MPSWIGRVRRVFVPSAAAALKLITPLVNLRATTRLTTTTVTPAVTVASVNLRATTRLTTTTVTPAVNTTVNLRAVAGLLAPESVTHGGGVVAVPPGALHGVMGWGGWRAKEQLRPEDEYRRRLRDRRRQARAYQEGVREARGNLGAGLGRGNG